MQPRELTAEAELRRRFRGHQDVAARRPTETEQFRVQKEQAAHERVLAERAADARYRQER
jgi:hypothetical protein